MRDGQPARCSCRNSRRTRISEKRSSAGTRRSSATRCATNRSSMSASPLDWRQMWWTCWSGAWKAGWPATGVPPFPSRVRSSSRSTGAPFPTSRRNGWPSRRRRPASRPGSGCRRRSTSRRGSMRPKIPSRSSSSRRGCRAFPIRRARTRMPSGRSPPRCGSSPVNSGWEPVFVHSCSSPSRRGLLPARRWRKRFRPRWPGDGRGPRSGAASLPIS